ncbi:MAG: hypothetical protein SVM80_04345 [Halobacteriota archaeon]|nr:hypothetical protein [Halobacteriota archaeon]
MKALLSVSDKKKIVEFAEGLSDLEFEIMATYGTAKVILDSGISVTRVSEITGFQEMLDGKIKTLHPKIHEEIMISEIRIVAVNLIPIDGTEDPLEKMDVGGVALIKSGIKSYRDVAVVVNPEKYVEVLKELMGGKISDKTRLELAIEASDYIVEYESKVNEIIKHISECSGFV